MKDENNANFISGPQNCAIHGNWSDYLNWLPCKNGKEKGFRYFSYILNPVHDLCQNGFWSFQLGMKLRRLIDFRIKANFIKEDFENSLKV